MQLKASCHFALANVKEVNDQIIRLVQKSHRTITEVLIAALSERFAGLGQTSRGLDHCFRNDFLFVALWQASKLGTLFADGHLMVYVMTDGLDFPGVIAGRYDRLQVTQFC
ncbi:hypothetical protein DPMN_060221 [Dreissena polymorpha]|uniref:Uncharacterized protein n=1 Tax=Dreissena polymorpha TaxID=45954 RepID=A0A9D4C5J1_DREPO|nr:hypothetical protein DPMN_060221 [Dreissena polymorpha]